MKDEDKTKGQLLAELAAMRDRIIELEEHSAVQADGENCDVNSQEYLERLELVFNATNDGIWDWDVKTGKSYFSPRYYTMLGYEPAEFPPTYESFRSLIHPADVNATEEVIQFSLEHQTSFAVEFRMKAKNGRWRWILSRGRALEHNDDGHLVRMVGSHTDITIRKHAEESLRLTQYIFNNAPIGIWKVSTEGKVLDVNDHGAYSLGYTHSELLQMSVFDFAPEVSPEHWNNGLSVLDRVQSRTIEVHHQHKNGKIFPVQVIEKLVRFGAEQFHVAFVQDISKQKEAELRLKESESKYRALIEMSPLGIGIVNADMDIVDGNQSLVAMLGYQSADLLELNGRELTHPDDVEEEKKLMTALGQDEIPSYSLEKRYRHKDGHYLWFHVTVAKILNVSGEGVFYFGFIKDINERRRLAEERERLILDLQNALTEIKELRGYIPICASCKKIRDDEGYWQQVEKYIMDRTDAQFSHGYCPECYQKEMERIGEALDL